MTKPLPYGFNFVTVKRTLMRRPVLHAPVLQPCGSHFVTMAQKCYYIHIGLTTRVSGLSHYGFMATNRHRNIMSDIGDWLLLIRMELGSTHFDNFLVSESPYTIVIQANS